MTSHVYSGVKRISAVAILQVLLTICCCGTLLLSRPKSSEKVDALPAAAEKQEPVVAGKQEPVVAGKQEPVVAGKQELVPAQKTCAEKRAVSQKNLQSEPENPFDLLPADVRGVVVMAKNKALLRKAAFPVYFLGRDWHDLYLMRFTVVVYFRSFDNFLQLMHEYGVSHVVVEKNNLTPEHLAAVAALREKFHVLSDSKDYCIFALDFERDGQTL